MEDFRKYATKHLGMNSNALDSYMNITSSYISDDYRRASIERCSDGRFFTVDDGPYHFFRYTG